MELPEAFDPRWNRLPGVTVDGRRLAVDPAEYFFRFESDSWLLCDWQRVRDELLGAAESTDTALEQAALDFVRTHGRSTRDGAEVLATAAQVYAHLFRDELLPVGGLEKIGPEHLKMLRQAATLMALNKVELTGEITVVGPAWFFAAALAVVFDLSDEDAQMLDEAYHGAWFTESRRVESVQAHAALGGRLVHGCQSSGEGSGGVVAPYGTSIAAFRDHLAGMRDEWVAAVYACRP